MTEDKVEDPRVQQALDRIESGDLDGKDLLQFYKNVHGNKTISERDREILTRALEKNIKLKHPREASKTFGSKDAEGRALLETIYEELKSEFDLSGNHVGDGIKPSGAQISGERYVGCYFSYKNSDNWNAGLYYYQDEVDSDPYLNVEIRQTGKGKENNETINVYSVDDVDSAVEDLRNTWMEIVD